jgi:hypothetical protein
MIVSAKLLVVSLMNRSTRIAVTVILLLAASTAQAAEVRAFHNINQLPFKQIFGLSSLDNSPLTEAGEWRLNLIGNVSNTHNITVGQQEQLTNDLETFRGSLTFTDDVYLDVAVAEDIKTATAADVAFQLALAVTF